MTRRCVLVDVDGESIRVQGNGRPLAPADVAAIGELVRAVKVRAERERAVTPADPAPSIECQGSLDTPGGGA